MSESFKTKLTAFCNANESAKNLGGFVTRAATDAELLAIATLIRDKFPDTTKEYGAVNNIMKSLDYASTKAEVITLKAENATLKARIATDVKVDVTAMEAELAALKAENTKLKASPAPVDDTKVKQLEAENLAFLEKMTELSAKVDVYREKAKKYYNKARHLKKSGSKSVDAKKADPTVKAPKSAKSAADVLVSGMPSDKKRKLDTTKPSTKKPAVSAEEKKLAADAKKEADAEKKKLAAAAKKEADAEKKKLAAAAKKEADEVTKLANQVKRNAAASRRRAEKRAEARTETENKLRASTDDESMTPADPTDDESMTPADPTDDASMTPAKKRRITAVDSETTPENSETEDESETFTEDEPELE